MSSRIVRHFILPSMLLVSVATFVACAGPPPTADNDFTGTDAGKKKTEKPAGSSPIGSANDLPAPTPPPIDPRKDAGGDDAGGNDPGNEKDGGGGTAPPQTPFLKMDVRYPVDADLYITQCTPDAKNQMVWMTTTQGSDEYSRWASASYREKPGVHYTCGTMSSGEYPIVLSFADTGALPVGTWLVKCVGNKTAHAYKITGSHAGHPAATYQYAQAYSTCP